MRLYLSLHGWFLERPSAAHRCSARGGGMNGPRVCDGGFDLAPGFDPGFFAWVFMLATHSPTALCLPQRAKEKFSMNAQ